jgi:membrane associated rhomboid family serine protease
MRIRAARLSLAITLAAVVVVGMAGSHAGAQFLTRPALGTPAATAHAAVAGLPGLHGPHAHQRVTAVDVLLAPATLLALFLLVAVVVRRSRPPAPVVGSRAHARGPPAMR